MPIDPLTDEEEPVCTNRVGIYLGGDDTPAATEPCGCPAPHPEDKDTR